MIFIPRDPLRRARRELAELELILYDEEKLLQETQARLRYARQRHVHLTAMLTVAERNPLLPKDSENDHDSLGR